MFRTATLIAALTLSTSAEARVLKYYGVAVEAAPGDSFTSIYKPTLDYDKANDEWVMLFDIPTSAPTAACPQGIWGLGRATSTDGVNWTTDANPVLEPVTDTYYGCAIAHGNLMFDKDDDEWHVWFKAHQELDVCDEGDVAWGCPPYPFQTVSGIGHAVSTDAGATWSIDSTPSLVRQDVGFPSVLKFDDGYYMTLQKWTGSFPPQWGIYDTRTLGYNDDWSALRLRQAPGIVGQARDDAYNPALSCNKNGGGGTVSAWVGGRRLLNWAPVAAIIGRFFTGGNDSWGVDFESTIVFDPDTDPQTNATDNYFHGWDVVRASGRHWVYASQDDGTGTTRITMWHDYDSTPSGVFENNVRGKDCEMSIPMHDLSETEWESGSHSSWSFLDLLGPAMPLGAGGLMYAFFSLIAVRRRDDD